MYRNPDTMISDTRPESTDTINTESDTVNIHDKRLLQSVEWKLR